MNKRLKSQMSLEIIISLLILVVVAVVVINMFLKVPEGIEKIETFTKEGKEYMDFERACSNACQEFSFKGKLSDALSFCSTRLLPEGSTKLLRVGVVDILYPEKLKNTKLSLLKPWPVCEDAVFCFHVFDCSEHNTKITIEDCRGILCEFYKEMFIDERGNVNVVALNNKVNEILKGNAKHPYGSCSLDRENWWTKYFGGYEVCTELI